MKKNFAIFGLVVLTLGGGMAFSQDVTPPVISNVSANPNPFTPNGDGNDETTTISFSLSEGAFVTINIAGTNYVDNIFYPTGPNQWVWDGDTLGDNNYLYQISAVDTIGNESDTVDNNVILNRDAPIIENIFAAPNPFSPNGDGTKDYFFVEFDVRRSSPDVYDTLFSPDTLTGILTVWRDSVGVKSVFNPVSKPPVYDYYIYVFPTVRFNSPVTITFFGMVGDVSVTIPANTRRIYRVGGLVDRFDESYYPPIV